MLSISRKLVIAVLVAFFIIFEFGCLMSSDFHQTPWLSSCACYHCLLLAVRRLLSWEQHQFFSYKIDESCVVANECDRLSDHSFPISRGGLIREKQHGVDFCYSKNSLVRYGLVGRACHNTTPSCQFRLLAQPRPVGGKAVQTWLR
jgi:hypothetical protein